jgi:hypothetical protein
LSNATSSAISASGKITVKTVINNKRLKINNFIPCKNKESLPQNESNLHKGILYMIEAMKIDTKETGTDR